MNTNHNKIMYSECGKIFKSLPEMQNHLKNDHKQRNDKDG